MFVKIFHTFLDELNPTRFFIKINPKGCHYYRIYSIAVRGTQNGWNDYSIYSFQFFEQIHFFLVCNNVIPSGFWKYYATFSIKISSLRDYAVQNVHPCSTRNPLKDNILPLSGIRDQKKETIGLVLFHKIKAIFWNPSFCIFIKIASSSI